jgi:hypothetical protein
MRTIASLTPTICKLLGVSLPSLSDASPLDDVLVKGCLPKQDGFFERCLLFAPDAIGCCLFNSYPEIFEPVLQEAPFHVQLQAVMPSITPVCFASMFTGAMPEKHGLCKCEKPQLKCETLFDALVESGKRVAIVAVKGSSIDRIFRGRAIDYFSETYDDQVRSRTLNLIEANQHDIIIAYQQEYDDQLHQTYPTSQECLTALQHHVKSFQAISSAINQYWNTFNSILVWATDHGGHIDPETGRGTHGLDVPEDMMVEHFYGFNEFNR